MKGAGGRELGVDLSGLKAQIEDLLEVDTDDLKFAAVDDLAHDYQAALREAVKQFGQDALMPPDLPFYCKEVKLAGDVKREATMAMFRER